MTGIESVLASLIGTDVSIETLEQWWKKLDTFILCIQFGHTYGQRLSFKSLINILFQVQWLLSRFILWVYWSNWDRMLWTEYYWTLGRSGIINIMMVMVIKSTSSSSLSSPSSSSPSSPSSPSWLSPALSKIIWGRTPVFERHDYFVRLGKHHHIIINLSFQGHYNENSWAKIEALTTEEILDTINHKNVSGIFLKVSFVVVAVVLLL